MAAELTAAIEGLAYLVASGVREVELLSDSRYLVRGMSSNGRTGWAHAAVEREWRTTRGKPLANRDFWERLLELEGCLAGGRTAAAFAAVTIRSCVSSGWETIAQCPLETSIVSALIRCANYLSLRVESPRRSRRPDSTRAATSRRECPSRRRTWTRAEGAARRT